MNAVPVESRYVLNHCAKYLARNTALPARHSYFGHLAHNPEAARFLEGWRFPVVDTHREPEEPAGTQRLNLVTFVWRAPDDAPPPGKVEIFGAFLAGGAPLSLKRVETTRYWSASVLLPIGAVYDYVFRVDGQFRLDPVNPRRRILADKTEWSFFYTDYCQTAVTFERWEVEILKRFTNHILPFNTKEGRIFLASVNPASLAASGSNLYRFDQAMGAVNFIDKILAGPELHQRDDYKVCLREIDRILRARNPFQEPSRMEESMYVALYNELGSGNVPGWDYAQYGGPSYFLGTVRRHTYMGAFSHPKYGGNPGGMSWDYLAEAFPPFDWRQALEPPLGTSAEYLG